MVSRTVCLPGQARRAEGHIALRMGEVSASEPQNSLASASPVRRPPRLLPTKLSSRPHQGPRSASTLFAHVGSGLMTGNANRVKCVHAALQEATAGAFSTSYPTPLAAMAGARSGRAQRRKVLDGRPLSGRAALEELDPILPASVLLVAV